MKKTALLLIVIFASCASQQDKNQEAIHSRITAFMTNPENMLDVSNYKALEYSDIDPLEGFQPREIKAFKLTLIYEGLNSASRVVHREADVFFNKGFEVIEVKTTKYLDTMSKEEYKHLGKTKY